MSEFTYKDYLPLNARIIVDYNARKGEKVKFSYPVEMTYEQAVWKRAYLSFLQFNIVLFFKGIFYIAIPTILTWSFLDSLRGFFFSSSSSVSTQSTSGYLISIIWNPLLFFLFIFIGIIPFELTYGLSKDKQLFSSIIPELNLWAARLAGLSKQIEFHPSDITENKIILPIFNNVHIHWYPEGDFNQYLEHIEILEYPFTYQTKFFFWSRKWKSKMNENLFRAVFHFSQTPLKGSMKVEFI